MSPDDYCSGVYNNCDTLSFLAYNIRSVSSNLESILTELNININQQQILALCETRLNCDIECLYNIEACTSYFKHRNTRGGGIALYIANRLTSKLIPQYCYLDENVESLFVEVKCRSKIHYWGDI